MKRAGRCGKKKGERREKETAGKVTKRGRDKGRVTKAEGERQRDRHSTGERQK